MTHRAGQRPGRTTSAEPPPRRTGSDTAVSRPRWRPPLLAFAALQCGLHAINHWVDVNNASSLGVGLFDAISLTVLTAVIAALWRAAATAPTREALP